MKPEMEEDARDARADQDKLDPLTGFDPRLVDTDGRDKQHALM
jgi:hypothetical protein